jgi:hypothetical protein
MIIKHGNNALSSVTAFPSAVPTGKPVLLSTATASGSASIEFTSGIDSTYDIYKFEFVNIQPATSNQWFRMNLSTDGGSNYNVTKTSSHFRAYHNEADTNTILVYYHDGDLAQSTASQILNTETGNGSDNSTVGTLYLFNPASSVFAKHYISTFNTLYNDADSYTMNNFVGGYGNTTSAVDAIQFNFASGNINSGTIKMYGISA